MILAGAALAACWVSVPLAQPGDDAVAWRFGPFQQTIRAAQGEAKSILIYFWMPGSDNCTRMYEETLQSEEGARATESFVCYSASPGDPAGAQLFERYGITTVPAIRIATPSGDLDDGLDGFSDVATFVAELARVERKEGTLRDLLARSAAEPDDLDLRNLLAGKHLDLGDQAEHDRLQQSIQDDDPKGETVIGAQLHFGALTTEVIGSAQRPDELDLERVRTHVRAILPEAPRFNGLTFLAGLEDARGDFEASLAVYREAWENVPEARVLNWGDFLARHFWSERELASKEDKALALDMARRAVARAELMKAGSDDGFGNRYSGDDYDRWLAQRLDVLARCAYMNGARKEAIDVLERMLELDPDNPVYAQRLELYGKRKPDRVLAPYRDSRPVWSPDGRSLLFTSDRFGHEDLFVHEFRKKKERRLTRFRGNEQSGAWSPDGKEIAFHSDRFKTTGIYVVRANGKDERALLPLEGVNPWAVSDPCFSPDGKELAYTTTENGKSEIAVVARDGSSKRILTAETPKTDMQPTWRGDRILFMSNRNGDSDVWAIAPDGSDEVNVTNAPKNSWDMDPDLSPDGDQIVFSSWRSGQCEIWVMAADGADPRPLTDDPAVDRHPRWSPDGKRIAFDREFPDGSARILVMNASGVGPEPLNP